MADPTTITEQIEKTAVEGVQSASMPGESVSKVSIQDLIAAENHLAAKRAATKNHLGMFMRTIARGGAG